MNYYLRLVATGFCFVSFSIGALVMSTLLLWPIRIFTRDPAIGRRRIKYIIHLSFRLFTWLMATTGLGNFKIEGAEKAQDDSGCIVLANHPSLIDVVVLISVYPQANCIVKSGLFSNFFLKNVLLGAGYVPSDLGEDTLKRCKEALSEGDTLVIFPEGTRSVPGQPIAAKRGASQIAIRLKAPIRLAHIGLNVSTLTKSEKWYKIPATKGTFYLTIGDKIAPADFPGNGMPMGVGARRLTNLVVEKLENKRQAHWTT